MGGGDNCRQKKFRLTLRPYGLQSMLQRQLGFLSEWRQYRVLHWSFSHVHQKEDFLHTSKLANQSFRCCHTADNTTTGYSFYRVLAVPCYQVIIVDNILLSRRHLQVRRVNYAPHVVSQVQVNETYIFLDDSSQTRDEQNSLSADLDNKQPFSREHCLAQSLTLHITLDTLGVCQVPVFA